MGDGSLKLKIFDLDKLDRLFPVPNTVHRGVDDLVLRGPKKALEVVHVLLKLSPRNSKLTTLLFHWQYTSRVHASVSVT